MSQSITSYEGLKLILRLVGGIEVCAIPFLLFPFSWMNAIHEHLLHLGKLPSEPIVEYMARCLTALYAVHGAMVVRISFDVARFRPLIPFLGWLHVALGVVVLLTDLTAGLPWWWIAGEGPGIAMGGLAVLVVDQQTPRDAVSGRNNSSEARQ